jgi:hypothetical protein
MSTPPRPATPSRRARLRALLAGLVLLGAVGSCQLPKPGLPSIGSAPGVDLAVVVVAARGGRTR